MHQRINSRNGWETLRDSRTAQLLRNPNAYEGWNNIIFNSVAELLFEGEVAWLAQRDTDGRMIGFHKLRRSGWTPFYDQESGELFYGISAQSDLWETDYDYLVPARDIAHFRMHTPRHPLIGESPIKAAQMAIGINVALNASQQLFFTNLSRPSGFLSTDEKISRDQIVRLKEAWMEASAAFSQGKVPVLTNGLKFEAIGIPQNDQQLIEQQRMSIADIARVFGVPLALINESTGAQSATEALISHWLSIGLGSIIECFEREIERFLRLPTDERIHFDPSPLLRVDFAKRMEGLAKGVQGGVLTLNEAREAEGFGKIDGGDEAFLQRQNLPVSLIMQLAQAELANASTPEATPALPVPAETAEPETRALDPQLIKALYMQAKQGGLNA
jgi:HK97 family phage portal protein